MKGSNAMNQKNKADNKNAAAVTPEQLAQIVRESVSILQNTTPPRGRPKKTDSEKLRGYRYNLNLDRDLKPFLHEIAWQKRTSITQYINDLIRREMEKYISEGGSVDEWENE